MVAVTGYGVSAVHDDVVSIELCPDWSPSSIKPRLEVLLSRCTYLQAAVGYCTVDDNFLSGMVAPALGRTDSFLCTDIHSPTDIGALADLARKGAHVRLLAKEIGGFASTVPRDPGGLMHAKMLLFGHTDGTAELWVGSHNWTRRAILGVNIEASIILRLRYSSQTFQDAANYLQKIKRECVEFDVSKIDLYRQLQQYRSSRAVPLVQLTGPDAHALADLDVTLFAQDARILQKLNRIGRKVYLEITDSNTGAKYKYRSEVKSAGSPDLTQFLPRRHSLYNNNALEHWLTPVEHVALSQEIARHFATLSIITSDPEAEFEYPTSGGAWEEAPESSDSLILRLDPQDRADLFGSRAPIIRLPSSFEPPQPAITGGPRKQLVQMVKLRKSDAARTK